MNTYLIRYKIATLAELIKPFEHKGFSFTAYDPKEWWSCDAWIASKEVDAKTAGEARFEFINGLVPLVERFSVLSQCAFRLIGNTYFIYKLTNNPEKIVYLYHAKATDPVGLHFDEAEILQLPNFDKMPNTNGLLYMLEAANTTSFYARLSMLIMAIEGFAGEVVVKDKREADKTMLVKILGKELYGKLYTYGTGLRHVLIHGRAKDDKSFGGLSNELYSKIMDFLSSKYEINLEMNVVDPQRSFYGNFLVAKMFEKFKHEPLLDLKEIEEAISDESGLNMREQDIFSLIAESPKDY